MSARATSASLAAAARLAASRLRRTRAAWLVALLGLSVTIAVALVERQHQPLDAASRSLDTVFSYLLPLTAFAITSLTIGRERLDDSLWCLARHGLPRRNLAVGLLLTSMLAAAALGAVIAAVGVAVSYASVAGMATDIATSSWIAALGACAYVAWFSLAATAGRAGGWRWLPLIADFTLGGGSGVIAALLPRAHLRSLIGGAPVLDLSQQGSSVLLCGMAAVGLLLAAWRAGS